MTADRTPEMEVALAELADAFDTLGGRNRLAVAQTFLAAVRNKQLPQQARDLWAALFGLTEDTGRVRMDDLVAVLDRCGSEVRQAVAITAEQSITADPPRSAIWAALYALVDAYPPEMPEVI